MKKPLPSEQKALKLLADQNCPKEVVEHCRAVAQFAVKIAECYKKKKASAVDVDLVRIGALLHDIGRAKTHSVDHGNVGAQIARELNLPATVVSIIEHHIGGGITMREAMKLGWPAKNYVPKSVEERIVAYADKLIEGSIQIPIEAAVERFRRDTCIPDESVERFRQWHNEFSACLR